MNIFKRTLNFLLSGTLALTSTIGAFSAITTNAAPNVSISDTSGILNQNKGGSYYYWRYNDAQSSAYGYKKAVYDVYLKVDSVGFDKTQPMVITRPSNDYITGFDCSLQNSDGSYTVPEIIGFETSQLTKFTIEFSKNGTYSCDFYASTNIDGYFTITVKKVNENSTYVDTTPPEIDFIIPDPSTYVLGTNALVTIQTNEICTIEISGFKYERCNSVGVYVNQDGKYKVTATDISGNVSTEYFYIDFISSATTPTTTTTTSTTTTTATPKTTVTTPETTTTVAKPTTTTPTTTTTTAIPTTTTITTTEAPITTTIEATTTTTEHTTTITTETTTMTTESNKNILYGDANCDGKVSVADSTAILQSIGNPDKYGLSYEGTYNADCYFPGSGVTPVDSLTILLYNADVYTSLPVVS